MEYQVYQKNSNARLRERETSKEGIKGYVEREKEKKEHTVSREVMHLKSGKGEIAVGVNRKGEVTLVISSDKEGELKEFKLRLGELTDDERDIILKGCLINYNRR